MTPEEMNQHDTDVSELAPESADPIRMAQPDTDASELESEFENELRDVLLPFATLRRNSLSDAFFELASEAGEIGVPLAAETPLPDTRRDWAVDVWVIPAHEGARVVPAVGRRPPCAKLMTLVALEEHSDIDALRNASSAAV